MRWRFLDLIDQQEALRYESTVAMIDAWWARLKPGPTRSRPIFSAAQGELPAWMAEHLQAIHPQLMWEFGPAVQSRGHRLVITPEAEKALRPLVATILERAPTLKGWEFYGYRLPEDLQLTLNTVEARTGVTIEDFKVRVSRGHNHRVDLCYSSKSVIGSSDQEALNASFVATETLLGEECLDKWIGAIEVSPLLSPSKFKSLFRRVPESPNHLLPLAHVHDTVTAVIESIREQLPPRPHCEWLDEAKWSCWRLNRLIKTTIPQSSISLRPFPRVQRCGLRRHGGGLFHSERFSRCGETFCYVKIDGVQGLPSGNFAERADIEDALTEALGVDGLGCAVGGGTGRRYLYVDLAIKTSNVGFR